MKKVIVISFNSCLYNEWTSVENFEVVNEKFDSLIADINEGYKRGNKFYTVFLTNGNKRAINMDYITDIWIKEVE